MSDPSRLRRILRRMVFRCGCIVACFLASMPFSAWWCARPAAALYEGSPEAILPLARGVRSWVEGSLSTGDYTTGSAKFNGEWLFGTYQMAGLGFVQLAREHPQAAADFLPAAAHCIRRLQEDDVTIFDTEAWRGETALESLDGGNGHAAYLGYFNLLLGAYLVATPDPEVLPLYERISEALLRRLAVSPIHLLETYPGECYPVDNTAVYASLVLYGRVTGRDTAPELTLMREAFRGMYRDAASGLLIQCVCPRTGAAWDAPRGSGTALGAYFLGFADMELARELAGALERLHGSFFGFGVVREYPRGIVGGHGDIDSGPVVFGWGFSATGFSAGVFRACERPVPFRRIVRTVSLIGTPVTTGDARLYACGGPLGDAIMFAMLTARKGGFR